MLRLHMWACVCMCMHLHGACAECGVPLYDSHYVISHAQDPQTHFRACRTECYCRYFVLVMVKSLFWAKTERINFGPNKRAIAGPRTL